MKPSLIHAILQFLLGSWTLVVLSVICSVPTLRVYWERRLQGMPMPLLTQWLRDSYSVLAICVLFVYLFIVVLVGRSRKDVTAMTVLALQYAIFLGLALTVITIAIFCPNLDFS